MSSSSINLSSYLNEFGSQSFNDELNLKRPQIELINQAHAGLRKIDESFSLLEKQPANAQILEMIASHQQQLVLSIVGNINSEFAIAQMLAQGIETLGSQLELLQQWTNGGVDMFGATLKVIYEELIANGINGMELEDVFQVALLEIMSDPEKYGLADWYEKNKDKISHILESTGSGSHGLHEEDYNTPEELAQACEEIFESLLNSNISENSFLGKVLFNLQKQGCPNALSEQVIDHYDDKSGWWAENQNQEKASLSPMLRLFLLSQVLSENPDISQEQVELFLNGSLSKINSFINEKFGSGALDFLINNTNWHIQNKDENLKHDQIDWAGDGIDTDDLEKLYKNFPERQLTEEEVKKLENISDQIKMLQETLKYWLSVIRDEQLSIARNI